VHDPRSYGRAFADVYDAWYGELTDAAATTAALAALVASFDEGRPVLELGVGTGRLAGPLAAIVAPRAVIGLDASLEMLDRLCTRAPVVAPLAADMAALAVADGSCALVFVAFNTLFNLPSPDAIAVAVADAARVLCPGGHLVVEAFVPPDADGPDEGTTERPLDDGRLLTWGRRDPARQVIDGLHVEDRPSGVRVRPWRVCYATPAQLDRFAADAGLELVARHADWIATPWDDGDDMHVSRYRRPHPTS
jgi:SAM-dependent methyltransferase